MSPFQSSFPQFADLSGNPLSNGYIYIGTTNLNPETNPIALYWDEAGTIPAAQPLRTVNGYIARNGTAARLYTSADTYSVTVRDSARTLVLSALDSSNFYAAYAGSTGSNLVGFIQSGSGTVATTAQSKMRQIVSVADFGAVGDGVTDDTVAFTTAAARGEAVFVPMPTSSYKIQSAVVATNLYAYDTITISGTGSVTSILSVPSSISTINTSLANTVLKSGTQAVTAIIQFPNNLNTIMQADKYGSQQNLLYYDADDGLNIGATDVRSSILSATPINFFRQHHHFRFTQVSALDPRISQTNTGGGSILFSTVGKMFIRTGASSIGDGVELRMPNIPVQIIAGQRLYFYLEAPSAANFVLEFGINTASGSSTFAKFTRTDTATQGNIFCTVGNGGTASSVDTAQSVGTSRRFYCIEIVSSTQIKMYVGTSAGVLTLYATFTSPTDNVPTSTCYPFMKLTSNLAAVNKEVLLSQMYFVLIE